MDRGPDPTAVERHLVDALPHLGVESGSSIVVAFSGGPDSTALAWGLARIAPRLDLRLLAVHVDHGLDPDSLRRSRDAERLATSIGLPCTVERLDHGPRRGDSVEAWARDARYALLDRHARTLDTGERRAVVATAHHADDQAETVLLRLLFGSGLDGLGGIRPCFGRRIRPLLELSRETLRAATRAAGLVPVVDPTNTDERHPRNRIRHRLLPELLDRDAERAPRLGRRLVAVADATRRALPRIDQVLVDAIDARPTRLGATCDRHALTTLPAMLRTSALAAIERLAGRPLPVAATARAELLRQLRDDGDVVGCDAGDGWRWHGDRRTLRLLAPLRPTGHFTYTLEVPGTVAIPELGLELRIDIGPVADWMFRGHPDRTALSPLHSTESEDRPTVHIRNRRPGDRIRPLGSRRSKRLKDLLIDRRVPRERRDRLPLLIVNDIVAWVPGVALDDRFRLTDEKTAWIAELRASSRADHSLPADEASVSDPTEKGRTP